MRVTIPGLIAKERPDTLDKVKEQKTNELAKMLASPKKSLNMEDLKKTKSDFEEAMATWKEAKANDELNAYWEQFPSTGLQPMHIAPNPYNQPPYAVGIDPYKYVNPGPFPNTRTSTHTMDVTDILSKFGAPTDLGSQIADMYELNEKWEFLQSIGYSLVQPGNELASNSLVAKIVSGDMEISTDLSNAFKMEVVKKFKALLLAKGTIKFKL